MLLDSALTSSGTVINENIEGRNDVHTKVAYLKDLRLVEWEIIDTHYNQMISELQDFNGTLNLPIFNSIRQAVHVTQEDQIYPTMQHILDTVKRIADANGCRITGTGTNGLGTGSDFGLVFGALALRELRAILEVKLFSKLFGRAIGQQDAVKLFNAENSAVKSAMHQSVGYCVKAGVKYGMLFSDNASFLFYVTLNGTEVTAHVSGRISRETLVKSLFHLFLCSNSSDWKLDKK
jgi:hypothetical protein